jgi:hypothetical protein
MSTLLRSFKIKLCVIRARDPGKLELSGSDYNIGVAVGPWQRSEMFINSVHWNSSQWWEEMSQQTFCITVRHATSSTHISIFRHLFKVIVTQVEVGESSL